MILIGCEESGVVTTAFRNAGYEAYSCDLQPTRGNPEWHIQGDVLDILGDGWDLLIGHPVCKYLANSGVCHLHTEEGRWEKMEQAKEFFYKLWEAPIDRICLENPIPHKYGLGKTYTQIIQPYQFGHPEQKATCLWLKNLPKLKETDNVKEYMKTLPKKDQQKKHYASPGPDRERFRSETYLGIAQAFVDQWGPLINR